jgi:hypothetical protein
VTKWIIAAAGTTLMMLQVTPAAGQGMIPFRSYRPHFSNSANEHACIRRDAAEAADCRAPGQRETTRPAKAASAGHVG